MDESRHGGCQCGGVTFVLSGPCRDVIYCHCSQCLKTHGNVAAYTNVLREQLTLLKETSLEWYRSSEFARRGFCNVCGASLFWSVDADKDISVSAGMLDVPTGLTSASHIFVDSQSDYYSITDGLPQYNESSK